MEHLPPAGWSHLATKDDVALSVAVLRSEIAELRTELKTDMAELRIELKTEIADLRTETRTGFSLLRADMEKGFRNQAWKMIAAMGTFQALFFAAAKLTN
jgi:ribosomal protein L29